MSLIPPSPLVAQAWVRSIPGMLAGVASTLPDDASSWAEHGFVQVTTVGGVGSIDVPMRAPVLSIDAWAVALNSGRAPVGKASQLLEVVRAACYDLDAFPVRVQPGPGDYAAAMVHSVYPVQDEPRRVPDPNGSYAHLQFDLCLMWTMEDA